MQESKHADFLRQLGCRTMDKARDGFDVNDVNRVVADFIGRNPAFSNRRARRQLVAKKILPGYQVDSSWTMVFDDQGQIWIGPSTIVNELKKKGFSNMSSYVALLPTNKHLH